MILEIAIATIIILFTIMFTIWNKLKSKAPPVKLTEEEKRVFVAVATKNFDLFEQIFEQNKINPNLRTQKGDPLLMLTVVDDDTIRFTEYLLKKGADPNIGDTSSGRTPLIGACHWSNFPAVKLLIAHGANVNAQTTRGMMTSPLCSAITENYLHIAKYLLENGADPRAAKDILLSKNKKAFVISWSDSQELSPQAEQLLTTYERWHSGRRQFALALRMARNSKSVSVARPTPGNISADTLRRLRRGVVEEIMTDFL
eukprot:TRINITY_DN4254_c0_g2_i4.p1 TRINITY_DN4254_c0_g2~~TRINITY_DN4254_c0_g2_i4.p1  ORF type:complete len:257 (+),score=47.36 TRINITY_DN4254_c0_g2_i4:260-1030(+)